MWRAAFLSPVWAAALVGLLCVTPFGSTARGDEPRLSISGYDPVAYFTDGKPVQGKPDLEYLWHKLALALCQQLSIAICSARIRSTTRRNTTAIVRWARRATRQRTRTPSIRRLGPSSTASFIWSTTAIGWRKWQEQAKEYIKRADANWQVVADLPAPTIVGAPCAASPPTTVVALRDGGHWLVVGGQVARDEAGNVVGKGDMRAQIEQVGKNVERASRPAAQPSMTSSLRSTTSRRPPNSTNTPICCRAISARLRRRAPPSPRRSYPIRTSCCRSRPSRRSSEPGRLVRSLSAPGTAARAPAITAVRWRSATNWRSDGDRLTD